jgi:hypothetical protein
MLITLQAAIAPMLSFVPVTESSRDTADDSQGAGREAERLDALVAGQIEKNRKYCDCQSAGAEY